MRAAQIVAPGRVVVLDAPAPAMRPGHALVRPLLIAICGSDLRKVYRLPPSDYPLPPGVSGHEIIGVVEEIDFQGTDADPQAVRAGDTVLALIPVIENGMAEYLLTPSENVLPLPAGVGATSRTGLEHLLMAQQLGTVVYACKRIGPVHGKAAVVIGQGSAGLFFNAMLKRLGAERVIAMDVVDARVEAAAAFGADHAFSNAGYEPVARIGSITGGAMADLVVEAVGEPETINLAARLVREGGELLYFGVPHEPRFVFDFQSLYRAYCHTTSTGSSGLEPGKPSFRKALSLIASREIDVSGMVTHRFPFEHVEQAYRLAHDRTDGAIKVIVEMPSLRQIEAGLSRVA